MFETVCALVEEIRRDVSFFFLANANTVIRRFVLLTYLSKARERFLDDDDNPRQSSLRRTRDTDVIRECSNSDGALATLPVAFAFGDDDDDDD